MIDFLKPKRNEAEGFRADAKKPQVAAEKAVVPSVSTKTENHPQEEKKPILPASSQKTNVGQDAAKSETAKAEAAKKRKDEEERRKTEQQVKTEEERQRKEAEKEKKASEKETVKRLQEEAKKAVEAKKAASRAAKNATRVRAFSFPRILGTLRGLNFVELFTGTLSIGGLAITPTAVRAVLLRGNETQMPSGFTTISEVPLPEGTIVQGRLAKPEALVAALKALKTRGRPHSFLASFAVLSLPVHETWSHVYVFPGNVTQEQFSQAMDLNSKLALPFVAEAAFFDWEETPPLDPERREGFLAAAKKEAVEPYLAALEQAKITVVAVEPFGASVARVLALSGIGEGKRISFAALLSAGSVLHEMVVDRGRPRYLRVVSLSDPAAQLVRELKLFFNFAVFEYALQQPEEALYFLEDGSDTDLQALSAQSEVPMKAVSLPSIFSVLAQAQLPASGWFAAIGAGMRGLVRRDADTIISLMAVGTEEAYARRRAQAWTGLASNIVIGFSVLLLTLFGVSYAFTMNQAKGAAERVRTQKLIPIDVQEYEKIAQQFNGALTLGGKVLTKSPRWDKLVSGIRSQSNQGVLIKHISADTSYTVTIAGTAASREALAQFKAAVEASPLTTKVDLSFAFFEVAANFPFTLSFVLDDPGFLYAP